MTTAFELASTNVYQPWNIHQAGEAYAVYNAHSRVSAVRETNHAAAPAAAAQDTANISGASALLAAPVPQQDARAARIEALRQSIDDGTYSVSADKVADSLIESLLA